MSITADRSGLDGRIRLDEDDSKRIEDPPNDIKEQLQAVEFEKISANVFVKERQPYTDSNARKVIEVRIKDNALELSSESVVGVVNLTPTSKIQINPKIGWSDILEMFLRVQEQRRSIEYQGVPIRKFLGDDLAIEDIFVVIAVNYLNSLEAIWREGLIRTFDTREYDALAGRGRLDIQQSLLNRSRPKKSNFQRFVEKKVDHNIPVHKLLHRAGKELLKLFKLHSGEYSHEGYYRIFEAVERQVRRFEDNGIESSPLDHQLYREVSLNDLPPTRHYYEETIQVSKMILSSSTGQPMAVAEQDLTMDYILNMNDLFEKYTQVVLEQKVDKIKTSPQYSGPDQLTVTPNRTIRLFQDDTGYNYQPDHVIQEGEKPVAVLDSKYYGGNKGPLSDSYARSRIFSYAFFLEVDDLAYLVPSGGSHKHRLNGRDGNLTVVGPEEFKIENYENTLESYLRDLISEYLDEDLLMEDLNDNILPFDDFETERKYEIIGNDEFRPDKVKQKYQRVIRYIADHSESEVRHYREANWKEIAGAYRENFKHHSGNDYAVPIYRPSDGENSDRILTHFIKVDTEEKEIETVTCGPYEINWKNHRRSPLSLVSDDQDNC